MADDEQRAFDKADVATDRFLPKDMTFRAGEKFILETTVRLEPWPTATHVTLYRTDKRGRRLQRSAQTFVADPNGEVTISWDERGVARIGVPDTDVHE